MFSRAKDMLSRVPIGGSEKTPLSQQNRLSQDFGTAQPTAARGEGDWAGEGGEGWNGQNGEGRWEDDPKRAAAALRQPSQDQANAEYVPGPKISPLQAAWNITNAIQGMFIVSLPFTVMQGGWWGVVALLGVAAICYYTGVILVECLYDVETGVRVRGTYRAVAEACWGRTWGGRVVLTAQLIELLMTCILYVVLIGDMMENAFPGASMEKAGWMLLSATFLLPCVFLEDLSAVSTLSLANTVSHVIINAIILIYCLALLPKWSFSSVRWGINIHTFPTVLGIVVFSYTSHIFLPALEGSLVDRAAFRPMLKYSHIAAAVLKALFGLMGFLAFADETQEEISNSLPSQEFKGVINLVLVFKALFSYPLPFYAVIEIVDREFLCGPPNSKLPSPRGSDGALRSWGIGVRVVVVLFTLFLALCIPHFAALMGLVGNITGTMLSFVWPCLFHLKLRGHTLSARQILLNKFIMALGGMFGTIGIYYSATLLFNSIYEINEYG